MGQRETGKSEEVKTKQIKPRFKIGCSHTESPKQEAPGGFSTPRTCRAGRMVISKDPEHNLHELIPKSGLQCPDLLSGQRAHINLLPLAHVCILGLEPTGGLREYKQQLSELSADCLSLAGSCHLGGPCWENPTLSTR